MIAFSYQQKEKFDEQVIDSAFKRVVESSKNLSWFQLENIEIHFVYAGNYYFGTSEHRLGQFIVEGMTKYKIKKVMVTQICMSRLELITKEKVDDYCNGKMFEKESVNDDLESFFEDLRFGKNRNLW